MSLVARHRTGTGSFRSHHCTEMATLPVGIQKRRKDPHLEVARQILAPFGADSIPRR